LTSCDSNLRITDFSGLNDLPKNPSKLVFTSNEYNYDEDTGLYGDPI
jgi:hypothetical protein